MIFRKMLGGGKFPGFVEENHSQYDRTTSTQLQLIGHVPSQYTGGVCIINYVGNDLDTRPTKRVREEPLYMQQNLGISSSTNPFQGEPGHIRTFSKPHPLSPGLRLSNEKLERSSFGTSTSENLKYALPGVLSLDDTVRTEIDRQMEELSQYIKLQEENVVKGGRELMERHTVSLLHSLEKGVNRNLQEKELEIENINRKNKELEDKIKEVAMEAQSWHYRAKYNESVANVLKTNFQELRAQGMTQGHEGFGDSEIDDALSCMKHPGDQELHCERLKCRCCKDKRASVIVFPCRHLCVCADCEGFIDVCPVCQETKTASLAVNVQC
ncbi:hypothetical protein ACS0TY_007078 [Phlomoides rotata]